MNTFTARDGEPAYMPDFDIDTPEDILADELGTTPAVARKVMAMLQAAEVRQQALTLGKVVGLLLETNNLPVMANAIAFAAGLDQLNGKKSQAEVARELGVTRALVSHYTVGVRDVLMDYVKPLSIRLPLQIFSLVWLVGCAGWAYSVLWKL